MKKQVLINVKIECDPPHHWRGFRTQEEVAQYYEGWVKEFHDFIRDHRSQDPVCLNVIREHEDQCSFCGYTWDTDDNGCPLCCQKAIDEWELARKIEDYNGKVLDMVKKSLQPDKGA